MPRPFDSQPWKPGVIVLFSWELSEIFAQGLIKGPISQGMTLHFVIDKCEWTISRAMESSRKDFRKKD